MLLDLGVSLVEIGHLERRQHFGETNETVNLKVHAAIAAGLQVVLCVGDSWFDREHGVAAESVATQVKLALWRVPATALASIVIAYEPGWAIGIHGEAADPSDVESMRAVIAGAVRDCYGDVEPGLRITYGGSVDPGSAGLYRRQTSVDGLFVGRAALSASGFIGVIEQFCTADTTDEPVVATRGHNA